MQQMHLVGVLFSHINLKPYLTSVRGVMCDPCKRSGYYTNNLKPYLTSVRGVMWNVCSKHFVRQMTYNHL